MGCSKHTGQSAEEQLIHLPRRCKWHGAGVMLKQPASVLDAVSDSLASRAQDTDSLQRRIYNQIFDVFPCHGPTALLPQAIRANGGEEILARGPHAASDLKHTLDLLVVTHIERIRLQNTQFTAAPALSRA